MYARYMVWDAIKFAFKHLLGFLWSVIPRIIITFIITGVISGAVVGALYYLIKMLAILPTDWLEFGGVVAVIMALIPASISVSIVILRVALGKTTDEKVPFWVTPIIRPAIKIFFSSLFSGILSAIATLLLIVPGIYVGLRLFFAKFCVIDHGHGPIKSLKCSWAITKSAKSDIWKLSFILFGFMLIGISIWYWMGMPMTDGITNLPDMNKIPKVTMHWGNLAYTLITIVMGSLVVLFGAHLYTELSQKMHRA